MKRIIIAIAVLIGGLAAHAQQDPIYTNYMFNTMAINPAYAGSKGFLTLSGLSRIQWVGIDGAPRTQSLIAHTPIMKYSIGLGLTVINDQIGPLNNTLIYSDYSFTFKINEKIKLALGLKVGFNLLNNSTSGLRKTDVQDITLNTDLNNLFLPNIGSGAFMYTNKWYAGFSTPKLLKNQIDGNDATGGSTEQRHYYIIGGFVLPVNNDWKFKPSGLMKMTVGAPASIDLSACFLYKDKIWTGMAFRSGDSFSGIFEINATEQIRVGYSYDFLFSSIRKNSSGSHEIMISYDFRFRNDKILSPRFF